MKIFIDHFPDQDYFVSNLARQIKKLNREVTVTTFLDIRESGANPEDKMEIETMRKSDIFIPIITSQYLLNSPEEMEQEYYILSDDENKTIFPIIYNDANWSSKNWIVKSKTFPSNNKTFVELNKNEQAKVINDLVRTIENILSKEAKQELQIPTKIKKVKNQIFISHCHSDADFAELLKLHLEKNNIDCWMDNERLKIGQDWREEIDTGISNSKAVIAIMSPEARKSEYVTYEWAFAWGKGIKIFPIMLNQTSLHPRLESLQYMDFTNRVTRPYQELVTRINEINN
ncbi:TIR domain-containing protein [Leeuwenhoekiella sp. A16]|uniref:toll/interleukin-1 receptor domain-containing protein n=1 Tax=Leeuwenhoekiella sp. A16 TaxID=3141462 RepID=UPI003A7FBF09